MAKDDNDFLDSFKSTSESNQASDDDHAFLDSFKSESQSAAEAAAKRTVKSVKKTNPDAGTLGEIVRGVPSGVADVGLTAGKAFYGIDELLGNKGSYEKYNQFLENRNKSLQENSSPGFEVGRVGGQVAATAPFVPARALKAADSLLPIAREAVKGGISGGIFGGLTSAATNKSVPENALEGATTGAVLGPVAGAAIQGGKTLAGKAKMWVDTALTSKAGNLDHNAVKAILETFEEAGLTPTQVQAELKRLGPKATLADIDPAFLTEAEGLAKSGGKPTSTMQKRFEARADTADYDTTHIINRNLGSAPDIEGLKDRIVKDAQKATKQDYETAHKVAGLDAQPVIDAINEKLNSAVGPKAAALQDIKSYFYKDAKDAQGNPIKVLKDDLKSLHEIRTQLDSRINDKNPTTSYEKNALNSVKDIRANLDAELKTIPEMASADAKYAERMDVLKGVDIGQKIFDRKINYNQFSKEFNGASAEKQNIIREGIKGKVYDALEQATRGELSEAQKLFGKNTANREKFKLAFGQNADEVLDALEKEATFRATEQTIKGGSRTGAIQAVQQKYGIRPKATGAMSDIIHGAMADAVSGGGGAFTAVQTAKRGYGAVTSRWAHGASESKISGAADILSRSGIARDNAMNTLSRVHAVRSRIPTQNRLKISVGLPTLPTAISEYTTGRNDK